MKNRFFISQILIGLSFLFTAVVFLIPELYIFGMNDEFLRRGYYHIYFIQFFTGVFIHGGILHLMMNSLFIHLFGTPVELMLGRKKYLLFFIFTIFLVGIMLTYHGAGNTVGISGFGLALLSYYTLELKAQNNEDYKGGVTAILINIAFGFFGNISLIGHFYGAIAGIIFYYLNHNFFRAKYVGFWNKIKE